MTDPLAVSDQFPPVLLTSLRRTWPHYGRGNAAGALEALRVALIRLTEGEGEGTPISAEAAVLFLRRKIELARVEFAGRDKKYVPHLQSWLNGRRYLAATPQETPKNLEDAISILGCYPNVEVKPWALNPWMPVLQLIDDQIKFLQQTHGAAAASFIRVRVNRFAELYRRWPDEERQFLPGVRKFFEEQRWNHDERTWVRTPKAGFQSERAQLTRLVQ
jgi:hypothetical protein